MNWQNLENKLCPHCSQDLLLTDKTGEYAYQCVNCSFTISRHRFVISLQRSRNITQGQAIISMRWQHLHDNACPICGTALDMHDEPEETRVCSLPTCPFRIKEAKVIEMFADPEHSVNRFRA